MVFMSNPKILLNLVPDLRDRFVSFDFKVRKNYGELLWMQIIINQ